MTPDEGARSPWITVWFSPRLTIERLVMTRPTYFVWLLAITGTIASLYNQISVIDGATYLLNWQLALGLVLLGIFVGVAWLYLAGVLLSWIGGLLGGRAPALHLRAAFAWSAVPTILGFIVILAIGAANGRGIALDIVPLVVAASALWSLVVFLLMLGRIEHFGFWRTILTYLFNLVLWFAVALFIRGFLYQPFNIPSASMSPTLLVGDYVFVAKFAYGYSRFSLPFSAPLPSGRVFSVEPAPGDVVVFRVSKDQAVDYVKRVVGLPGDRIQMKQGRLYINDTAVKREPLARIFDDGASIRGEAFEHHRPPIRRPYLRCTVCLVTPSRSAMSCQDQPSSRALWTCRVSSRSARARRAATARRPTSGSLLVAPSATSSTGSMVVSIG